MMEWYLADVYGMCVLLKILEEDLAGEFICVGYWRWHGQKCFCR